MKESFTGFLKTILKNYAFSIAGDIASLPAGELAFAAGIEYREEEGSFEPDSITQAGDDGRPGGEQPTFGAFDVSDIYAELSIPLFAGAAAADLLEVNLAARNSNYNTIGSAATYKISSLWRPIEELSFRASFSTGIRTPDIGEAFGQGTSQNPRFLDPCTDFTGILGSQNGGRDTPQDTQTQANCATLGVPVGCRRPLGPACRGPPPGRSAYPGSWR